MGTPIIAYGAAALTSYANADTACSTADGGTQLKGELDNPIQLVDSESAYYLAAWPGAEADIYTNGAEESPTANSWADGQTIYLAAQSLTPAIGGRSSVSAGYYTLEAINISDEGEPAVYVYQIDETSLADTTACPHPYTYPDSFFDKTSDSGNDKQFQPMPDGQGTGEGILIDRNKNINLDFKMRTGRIYQVPFTLAAIGPQSLRGRGTSVYKCSTGDGDET